MNLLLSSLALQSLDMLSCLPDRRAGLQQRTICFSLLPQRPSLARAPQRSRNPVHHCGGEHHGGERCLRRSYSRRARVCWRVGGSRRCRCVVEAPRSWLRIWLDVSCFGCVRTTEDTAASLRFDIVGIGFSRDGWCCFRSVKRPNIAIFSVFCLCGGGKGSGFVDRGGCCGYRWGESIWEACNILRGGCLGYGNEEEPKGEMIIYNPLWKESYLAQKLVFQEFGGLEWLSDVDRSSDVVAWINQG